MSEGVALDDRFWRSFVATYWNRQPTVIRAPFRDALVQPAELFQSVLRAKRRLRQRTDEIAVFAGGRRIVMKRDLEVWLPRSDDRSLEGYFARLKATSPEPVAMYVSEFQAELGWRFLERMRVFLRGLYAVTGVPAVLAEVDLFLGNYARTPAGVHRDSAAVFCFVVGGRKRIRAWPDVAIRSHSPRTGPDPYADYLNRSVCLDGEPGDVLYWPATYWHVAESDGEPVASLSLGLYYGSPLMHAMARNAAAWARVATGGEEGDSLPLSPVHVPHLAAVARRAALRHQQLRRLLLRDWIERISGYGFRRLPPRSRTAPFGRGRRIRTRALSHIMLARLDDELLIAANGRSIAAPHDRVLEGWLRRLSDGQACDVDALLRGRSPVGRKLARDTLRFLLEQRAVGFSSTTTS